MRGPSLNYVVKNTILFFHRHFLLFCWNSLFIQTNTYWFMNNRCVGKHLSLAIHQTLLLRRSSFDDETTDEISRTCHFFVTFTLHHRTFATSNKQKSRIYTCISIFFSSSVFPPLLHIIKFVVCIKRYWRAQFVAFCLLLVPREEKKTF